MKIGFLGLLALLFIGLKLGAVIAWSWWWVLAPLWLPAAAAVPVILFFGAIFFVKAAKATHYRGRR